jgi:hypothetical protein
MNDEMREDWLVVAVEQVADSARAVCETVEVLVQTLDATREARLAGGSVARIVDDLMEQGAKDVRLSVAEAFLAYERSLAAIRAGVVRALVDDDGLSLTDVARRLQVSRQAVARLYQNAR